MSPELVAAIVTMGEQTSKKAILIYDPQRGLGWRDKRGWDVYFGMDVANIAEKIIVYRAIKAQLRAEGITPVIISVEQIHAPYYRLEP